MKEAKGYKQTEVGLIPNDWDLIPYGHAFDFLPTATYSRDELSDNNEIGYVHYGDIHTKWKHFLDFEKNSLPTIENSKLINYALIKDGDLIMADASEDYNGIGTSVEVKNIETTKAIAGLHTFLLRDKNVFVDGFRAYIHLNQIVKKQFDKLATGMKVYGVSKNNLKLVLIPTPPKEEQKEITKALTETDSLISALEKLLAKKKSIKQGVIQELLAGKKRLKGFSGDWETKKLGEIAEIVGGGTPSTFVSQYWNGTINWFTPTEIGLHKYTYESLRKITKQGFVNSSGKMLPIGSILLTTRAGIGDVSILKCEGCTNQGFQSLIAREGFSNEYIYYLMLTLKNILIQNASGSTFLEISPNKIKQIEVLIPDLKTQIHIVIILKDIDSDIENTEKKLNKYKMLKQGMMQNLLTGKVRLT